MRDIKQIIVHCASTKPSMDIGAKEIREWHTKERGWSDIGYHWVIKRDGAIESGRDEKVAGAHARSHNGDSIGVCLAGGMTEDGRLAANFTFAQYSSLVYLVNELKDKYPDIDVKGHRDLAGVKKECPCFDVKTLLT